LTKSILGLITTFLRLQFYKKITYLETIALPNRENDAFYIRLMTLMDDVVKILRKFEG